MAVTRAWSRAAVFALVLLLVLPAAARAREEPIAAAAALQFSRVETVYRQLRAVDPECRELAAWGAVALAFSEIPERFPTDPIAADALWRVGEIHACQARAGLRSAGDRARDAYRTLTARYPTSSFAPDAYLRLAQLSPAESQTYLYRLLERYPRSEAARTAQRILRGEGTVVPAAAGGSAGGARGRAAGEERKRTANEPGAGLEAAPTPASGPAPGGATGPAEEAAAAEEPAHGAGATAGTAGPVTPAAAVPAGAPARTSLAQEPGGAGAAGGDRSDRSWGAPRASGTLLGVRHYSDAKHTRVVFDLDAALHYVIGEAADPPRLFVDLVGARLAPGVTRSLAVDGTGVKRVRVGVNRPGVVRLVLELAGAHPYTFFTLADPPRLVVDVPGRELAQRLAHARRPAPPEGGAEARQLSLGVRRIVIDPGHGGTAPGAIGRSGITEKELTLDIARRLADNLRRSGFEAILTRNGDRTIPLEERPGFATRSKADLFVSIHVNSANSRKLSGFETYYLDLATDPTAAAVAARENAAAKEGIGQLDEVLDEIVKNANKRESRDLANSIQDSLVLQLSKKYEEVRDLGVKHAPFVVLVGAEMPAVLVECSFLSNPTEEKRLRDPSYRQELADALLIGIENYVARRRMLTEAE